MNIIHNNNTNILSITPQSLLKLNAWDYNNYLEPIWRIDDPNTRLHASKEMNNKLFGGPFTNEYNSRLNERKLKGNINWLDRIQGGTRKIKATKNPALTSPPSKITPTSNPEEYGHRES